MTKARGYLCDNCRAHKTDAPPFHADARKLAQGLLGYLEWTPAPNMQDLIFNGRTEPLDFCSAGCALAWHQNEATRIFRMFFTEPADDPERTGYVPAEMARRPTEEQ